MSDFDDFDDLDAVRDFRSTVGLLTPEADRRIRHRIFELAQARGLADQADEDEPPVLAPVPSRSSSDGSAAVVELRAAARPPTRQPRVPVAAAAAVLLALVIGAVAYLGARASDDNVATEGSSTTLQLPPSSALPTTTTAPGSVDALRAALVAARYEGLNDTTFVVTVDTIEQDGTPQTVTQRRGTDGGDIDDGSGFRPMTSPPYAGFSYVELQSLTDDVEAIEQELLDRYPARPDQPFQMLQGILDLLRLPVTPKPARSGLLGVLEKRYGLVADSNDGVNGRFLATWTGDAGPTTITFQLVDGALQTYVHPLGGGSTFEFSTRPPEIG